MSVNAHHFSPSEPKPITIGDKINEKARDYLVSKCNTVKWEIVRLCSIWIRLLLKNGRLYLPSSIVSYDIGEDSITVGKIAVLECLDKYCYPEIKFTNYAYRRIRGIIIDNFRHELKQNGQFIAPYERYKEMKMVALREGKEMLFPSFNSHYIECLSSSDYLEEDLVQKMDLMDKIFRLRQDLTFDESIVFCLKYFNLLTVRKISQILFCSEVSVWNKIKRIKLKINHLKSDGGQV